MTHTPHARTAVLQALSEVTGRPPETIDTAQGLDALGLDSLDFVRVVQLTEDAASVRLDDASVSTVQSPDDLITLIAQVAAA